MNAGWLGSLSELVNWSAVLGAVLWSGLVTFTIGLSFLLWTRWGEYHLPGKCVLFSVLAHLLCGLFLTTGGMVQSVREALAAVKPPEPITIDHVQIVRADDDAVMDSTEDGRLDEPISVGVWDRPHNAVQIESPTLANERTALPQAEPATRTEPTPAEPLPKQSPKPEIPLAAATPPDPQPARPAPEAAERTDTPVEPVEPVARQTESAKETLPSSVTVKMAPAFGTGEPARTPQTTRGEVPGDAERTSGVLTRVPAKSPASADLPDVPTSAVAPQRRAEGTRRDENKTGPIAAPESISSSATPSQSAARNSGGVPEPSARYVPGSPSGLAGPSAPEAPQRAGTPGGDGLPLPPPTVLSSAGRPATGPAAEGPRTASAVRPSGPVADRPGIRLGTPQIYQNRLSPNRSDLAITRGGSRTSEEAVERALKWLAAHQHKDGHWDVDKFRQRCPAGDVCTGPGKQNRDDCAVTGLVLLAFLGAGNTHQDGKYTQQVAAGINWLLAQQKPTGDLRGTGRMYSQGIATLALSEALGMTGDSELRGPVERAVKFIIAAQNSSSGGWRYNPGDFGDTSIFGWQVMALKSAALAGISVPDATWQKARGWLALVGSGRHRGLARYMPNSNERETPAMTAEAMACREFLGAAPGDPAVQEAAEYLMDYLPQWGRQNLYYWYYGTVASFQVGGDYWKRWNTALRDPLINHQRREGHAAGSWDPEGDLAWGTEGGRVYTTALATLCLEVYYRFLPLQSISSDATTPARTNAPRANPALPRQARRPE